MASEDCLRKYQLTVDKSELLKAIQERVTEVECAWFITLYDVYFENLMAFVVPLVNRVVVRSNAALFDFILNRVVQIIPADAVERIQSRVDSGCRHSETNLLLAERNTLLACEHDHSLMARFSPENIALYQEAALNWNLEAVSVMAMYCFAAAHAHQPRHTRLIGPVQPELKFDIPYSELCPHVPFFVAFRVAEERVNRYFGTIPAINTINARLRGGDNLPVEGNQLSKDLKWCNNSYCCVSAYSVNKWTSCGKCKKVRYCSQECRSSHLKKHKKNCKVAKPAATTSNAVVLIETTPVERAKWVSMLHETLRGTTHNSFDTDISNLAELQQQARDFQSSNKHARAAKCYTTMLHKLSRSAFWNNKNVDTYALRLAQCAAALFGRAVCNFHIAEQQRSLVITEQVILDCNNLLHSELFDAELLSQLSGCDISTVSLVGLCANAKQLQLFLLKLPMYQGRGGDSQKASKSSSRSRQVVIVGCDVIVEFAIADNAQTAEDFCPICQTAWSEFPATYSHATVLPCSHALCVGCLARFLKECQISFEQATSSGALHTSFCCVLCREAIDEQIVENVAHEMVSKKLTAVFDRLLSNLMLVPEERTRLITSLLVQNSFDFSLVEKALFHFVGVMRRTNSELAYRLTTEQKQMMYKQARAPVEAVERDYLEARTKLWSIVNIQSSQWRVQSKKVDALSERLTAARANAAQDLFERINSEGSGMGERTNNKWCGDCDERRVDLHGLHKAEAESAITQFVLPILPVCKSIVLITGKGLHSNGGGGGCRGNEGEQHVLRDSVMAFLKQKK
eukprot:gene33862-41771_t